MKRRTSIAIIGSGIIGASIAYNLASKGETDVAVFDKGRAGAGSTSAALGGFRHQFSTELNIRMSEESIAFFREFQNLTGYDPLIKTDGYMFVAETGASLRQLEKNRSLQQKLGVKVDSLSAEQLRVLLPFYDFKGILGGSFCPEDGHASTLAILQGFLSNAKEAGIQFYENSEVTKIDSTKEGKVRGISVDGREIDCEKLIIAAGAYSGLVGNLANVDIPVVPVPRRVLVTNSFSIEIPKEFPLIVDVDSTLALGREGMGIVMGDNVNSSQGFELNFPAEHDERLLEKAIERIPVLARASVAYANQGLYEVTPDSNPIISSVPEVEGLYCCAGFSGHGFMHSPSAGKLMAEIVLGQKPHFDVSSLDIRRFQDAELDRERLII